MKRISIIFGSVALLVLLSLASDGIAQGDSLPELRYLGEGPGTFDTPLDNFIVKTRPFDFRFVSGPTYEASSGERVWGSRGTDMAPPAEWDIVVDLGQVEEGCIAEYVGIDDDVDDRINSFELDGEVIETVTQGMDFGGSFVVPRDGDLTFVANDSVGSYFTPCADRVEPTPTPTLEPTVTLEPTATATVTPGPSPTATDTATPGPSPTADTATPGPSLTATSTAVPPEPTITSTPEPSPTPTKRPRKYSCVRINFEVSGHDAARGLYIVQETGGKLLASWYALDGWQDSGWFKDIDITHENVYVQVLYYRGPDTEPVELTILNHAPDSPYGWMSWGVCHALEVAWPGEKPEGAIVPEDPAPAASAQSEQAASSAAEEAAPAEQTEAADQPATSAVESPAAPAADSSSDVEEQNSLAPASLNG